MKSFIVTQVVFGLMAFLSDIYSSAERKYKCRNNYPNIKFTRKELQTLFEIATFETYFNFNNEI